MDRYRMDTLAQTLKATGLAASATEAARMAESIICTEKKVGSDFDRKRNQVETRVSARPTYTSSPGLSSKSEIEQLIEKTSFEKKSFFVPIKGYTDDRKREGGMTSAPQRQEEIPQKPVVVELSLDKADEAVSREKEGPQPSPSKVCGMDETVPQLSLTPEKLVVYTPDFEGNLALKDLMEEEASSVSGTLQSSESETLLSTAPDSDMIDLGNNPTDVAASGFGAALASTSDMTGELEVKEVGSDKVQEEIALPLDQKERFILELEEELKNAPEKTVEIKTEKSRDGNYRTPIEKVDLMNFFKSG